MSTTVQFPGSGRQRFKREKGVCKWCGEKAHEHDKERVYPEKGPAGSYHYRLYCTGSGE